MYICKKTVLVFTVSSSQPCIHLNGVGSVAQSWSDFASLWTAAVGGHDIVIQGDLLSICETFH